ncbi:5-formyltetrahydrofolate cyclo-ligase [Rhizobium helianthi]|uniref:5-formyltetrahydrofolate cyclo-ligase n=1 Tax=Rhizobium helianthi TaxID=1132695 RepID=A0ABW4M1A3_9HYPH
MTDRAQQKARLRAECLAARDRLPAQERIDKSLAIADHGLSAVEIEPGEIVSGFTPIRSEADIRPLMSGLKAKGTLLCLPVILDKTTIVFRELRTDRELIPMGFGTFGPGPDCAELDPSVMLVPLAGFDAEGQRIGYGGGYYDRAIERLHRKGFSPRLIGIAFDCQEVASVPAEPHDMRLHAVLTESGLRRFNS